MDLCVDDGEECQREGAERPAVSHGRDDTWRSAPGSRLSGYATESPKPKAQSRKPKAYSAPSPTRKRMNRLTWMFSPVFALAWATSWLTVTLSSRMNG